jgi:hypothetical protein
MPQKSLTFTSILQMPVRALPVDDLSQITASQFQDEHAILRPPF